ncbi:MAG: hypothetical protein HGA39_05635 [Coriobacteriia bacterium]|nr:hypothetical protein [Coriobacteriia bacterium]
MDSTVATAAAQGMRGPGGTGVPGARPGGSSLLMGGVTTWVLIGILAAMLIVLAITFWQAYKRTGRQPALGLLMLIPVVNLGVAFHFAFGEWPILKEMKRLKMVEAMVAEEAQSAGVPEAPTSE